MITTGPQGSTEDVLNDNTIDTYHMLNKKLLFFIEENFLMARRSQACRMLNCQNFMICAV